MSILVDLVKQDFGLSGRGRWYRSDVHSSLVVDAENDIFFFNSRDLRGSPVDYLMKIRGFSKQAASDYVRNVVTTGSIKDNLHSLQVRFDKLVDLFHTSGRDDRQYWYDRLLTDSTIDRYRLGYFEGWNLIPIFDDGLFYNFQCRKDVPEKKIRFWYKDTDFKPVLFNRDVLKFVDTIYIVEGMVDCILLNQLGLPSVCSTNGAMSWNQGWIRYFSKMKNIYYVADNDKAGIASAKRTSDSLGSMVKIMRFRERGDKYGALNYFKDGGTVDSFKQILLDESVFPFEKELI